MAFEAPTAFFSYCREDSAFALRLAEDLKAAGAAVWMDQLDIEGGQDWPKTIEAAMVKCSTMIVVLSPSSVASNQVRAEYHFALDAKKKVVPVLRSECEVPFHLGLVHRVDFRTDYNLGLKNLLKALAGSAPQPVIPSSLAVNPAGNVSLTGSTVSHYRVLEVIGGGGQGVVYRAEDQRLGRAVALKFLPEQISGDQQAVERFEGEAHSISALDHPNICSVFEFGEHRGRPFIVMPLLHGRTLRDRLQSGHSGRSALPLASIIDLAIQIAEGLEAAHRNGIIHRDIKPANIFVTTNGTAKILDFRLAKVLDGPAATTAQPQSVAGMEIPAILSAGKSGVATLISVYRSPEQIRGEPLDARSDLFSFGLVLYEMATGQAAFSGPSVAAACDAILKQAPVSACELNPAIPPDLASLISKALAKNREQRYQRASELRDDLRHIRHDMDATALALQEAPPRAVQSDPSRKTPEPIPPEPGPQPQPKRRRKWIVSALIIAAALAVAVVFGYRAWRPPPVEANASIVVLPFLDESPGHDQEYFSDGLTEQLINDLARIPGLSVIARSSAFQFKGRNVDPREIGRTLNVGNILEGSVRRDGNRVRITVELTKAADGFQLWSVSYDRQLEDIFAVQDEIARGVARELQLKLTGSGGAPVSIAPLNTTPAAYEAYLQGRYFYRRRSAADLRQALAFSEEAIKADPRYAPAFALRANVLGALADAGAIDSQDGHTQARKSAQAAIGLDPTLADAYVALTRIQVLYDFDITEAGVTVRKAVELEPGNAEACLASARVISFQGHLEEAIELGKRCVALDPLNGHGLLGTNLYNAGRFQEAEYELNKALELNPNLGILHYRLGSIRLVQNQPDAALAQMQQEKWEEYRLLGQSMAYHAAGREQESLDALNRLVSTHQKDASYAIASAYAYRGDVDQAFAWIERAYQARDGALPNLKVDPVLKNLHSDPRYQEWLKKLGL